MEGEDSIKLWEKIKENKLKIFCFLIIVLILSNTLGFTPLSFQKDAINKVPSILGLILVIALLLERTTEVFLSTWRSGEADLQDNKIQETKTKIKTLKENKAPSAEMLKEQKALDKLLEKRTRYRMKSREYALWGGLIMGILVASAGIRIIEWLIDPETFTKLDSYQINMFKNVDIVITACMLAGGSEAINKITKVYNNFLQSTAEKAKDKNT